MELFFRWISWYRINILIHWIGWLCFSSVFTFVRHDFAITITMARIALWYSNNDITDIIQILILFQSYNDLTFMSLFQKDKDADYSYRLLTCICPTLLVFQCWFLCSRLMFKIWDQTSGFKVGGFGLVAGWQPDMPDFQLRSWKSG